MLEELAAYVIAICKVDLALILSSGFDATGEHSAPPATAIEIVDVQLEAPGEAIVRVKKAAGAGRKGQKAISPVVSKSIQ